ncbi:unnamed protein product, partial [Mesorhabditis spiculigera]
MEQIVIDDEHVLNERSYEDVLRRRRMMFACCLIAWLAVIILIAAMAIPKWEVLTFTNIDWEIVRVELGVWGEWRQTTNTSRPITEWIPHFPAPPAHLTRLAGEDLKHYYRAQAVIGIIGLVLLIATNLLAMYTFYHHRYTYKRLTAALYFVCTMCVLAAIEVLSNSVDEWNTTVVAKSQDETHWDYDAVRESGYAKYMAYSVVIICALSSLTFLYGSHKQKGENAATAEFEIEDRPIHMGRLMSVLRRGWKQVKEWDIRTEPLIFFLAACNSVKGIVTPSLSEAKMKRTYILPPGAKEKTFYNKKMVLWDQNYDYVNLPIACIIGVIYGGYSDHYGRKWPMLIGILSVVLDTAFRILIWHPETDWPLQWIFAAASLAGFLGDFLLTMSAINAYVTDQFPDKKTASLRMIVVSILFSLGQFGGSQLADWLLHFVSEINMLIIVEGVFVFSFFFGLFLIDNRIPAALPLQQEENPSLDEIVPPPKNVIEVAGRSFVSLWESVKIFFRPREGHRRLFLWLCFVANFLDQFVFGEEKGLIGTYTRLSPFNWDTHTYAQYKSWRPIVQIIGLFVGTLLFKKLFRLRDSLVITFAIASMGLCAVAIGLAHMTWVIFASLPVGSLHGLLNPLTYSFMSCLIEQNEIGKAFAVSSIAQKLAGIAQTAILQNIYTATVDWYMGFVWLLMGGITAIAVAIYAVVHVIAKREGIEPDP